MEISEGVPTCSILAWVHDDDAIRNLECFFLVVRHEYGRHVNSSCKRRSQLRSPCRTLASSAPNGSSSNKTRGSIARPAQRDTLPLAARELRRVASAQVLELDQTQELGDFGVNRFLARPQMPRRTRKPNAMFSNTLMCLNNA